MLDIGRVISIWDNGEMIGICCSNERSKHIVFSIPVNEAIHDEPVEIGHLARYSYRVEKISRWKKEYILDKDFQIEIVDRGRKFKPLIK